MKEYILELNSEIENKETLKKVQEKYNYFLENSIYNRQVSDFVNGNYKDVGNFISYKVSTASNSVKYNYGYNFNHTLSPFYLNYQNKLNVKKIQEIMKRYKNGYQLSEKQFFVTLTMPSTIADVYTEDIDSVRIKKANQTISNLFKQLEKKFDCTGMIKKYECTFKYSKGKAMSHPHFHLVLTFKNKQQRWLKSTLSTQSINEYIFEYWYKNFVNKQFNVTKNDARASYDFKSITGDIAAEIAGYISKGNKRDYLLSQEIFDYAYVHLYNKRLITFSGIFKKINKELKLDDITEIEELEKEEIEYDYNVSFYYNFKERMFKVYKVTDIRSTGLDNSTSSSKNVEEEIFEFFRFREQQHKNKQFEEYKINSKQLNIHDFMIEPGE